MSLYKGIIIPVHALLIPLLKLSKSNEDSNSCTSGSHFHSFNPSNAKQTQPFSNILNIDHFLEKIYVWGGEAQSPILISGPLVFAEVLNFIASAISSAGGVGGDGLFIPATCAPQVLNFGDKSLIDYDIALSSQPCMHVAGSESRSYLQPCIPRMIDLLFAIFLARSTSKTCTSGLLFWKVESEEMRKNGLEELEKGLLEEG
uniref:Uncharacterized protein n=1 Tax=Cajanus cajan TaxID=3821 RepID=A0A151SR65_CAJCA|nr:hypothetical protein KK1_003534 [Cajanus cajan]